ncbi:MAG TPA: bacteriocin fulvocin C-related protein [Draconibacterium sp.]|nr:bacteriocin fulvocin C-related protein [Draconibacterium sp.]
MNKIFFAVIIAFLVISCEEEQISYSCDPEIDAIVKSGVIESSQLDLSELLEYDIQLQKAIYRSMSPQKKKAIWIERLDKIMTNKDFSLMELGHIDKLKTYVMQDSFDPSKDDQEILDVRKAIENEWKKIAIDKLNWDLSKVGFMVSSLYVSELKYQETIQDQIGLTLEMLEADCSCSSESSYCGGPACIVGGCTETSACGWLWQYSCDGYCNY